MRGGFFFRLACNGIRKNSRVYLPYLLTCVGLVTVYYIVSALAYSTSMQQMLGATTMGILLQFGKFVITVFSCIFLFYTNSFLTRRRRKEFGLYNVLGMSKQHLARILLAETLVVTVIALVMGIVSGVVLSKLAELALLRMLREEINYDVMFSSRAILEAVVIFTAIFLVLMIYNILSVSVSDPLSLMRSETVGEKPPRARFLMTVLGFGLLGGAYYMAVSIRDPLEALTMFFVAVIMVIVATYLLLISGSVTLCRLLQKRKSFYYKPNHFVSVSSMAYRMKRSGAGLASICILSTMVLVTLTSTGCLYYSMEDMVSSAYPRSVAMGLSTHYPEEWAAIPEDFADSAANAVLEAGGEITSRVSYRSASLPCIRQGESFFFAGNDYMLGEDVFCVMLVPLEDYIRQSGRSVSLSSGEVLAYCSDGSVTASAVNLEEVGVFQVREYLQDFPINTELSSENVNVLCLIIPDGVQSISRIQKVVISRENYRMTLDWCFEYELADESVASATAAACEEEMQNLAVVNEMTTWFWMVNRSGTLADLYAIYGGLFFLGTLLSLVFAMAAVLMIYYKQISEGYEDQSRFAIMQKVGMTHKEIRSSVNSQILIVFFIPLILAGVHLAFAFPLLQKMLYVMAMTNLPLLLAAAVGCYLAFAAFYALVYKLTSNVYYRIVSGNQG